MELEFTKRKTRPPKKRKYKVLVIMGCVLVISIALFISLSNNMRSAMSALATARIKSVAARAMNDAILDSMADEANYASLIETMHNGERVYMLQANTRNLNILAADCAAAALERISEMGEQGISIPIGTITGVSFFAGKGMPLKAFFTPAGSVQSEFNSEFISSGINQTLYRVNLKLIATVKLVLPNVAETITVYAEAAIAESIIVGDVPQVYTNVANEKDMLNLIPNEVPK